MIQIKLLDYVRDDKAFSFRQGEGVRTNYLADHLRTAKEKDEILEIDLDGFYGFTPQFLRGAFASSSIISREDFKRLVRFVSGDQPGLIEDIRGYIENAEFSEELRQEVRKNPGDNPSLYPWLHLDYPQEEAGEDKMLEACDGYSDKSVREIVVRLFDPDPEKLRDLSAYSKKVLRHEIVHAFLHESGLSENSSSTDAWAANEEMVDWMAIQGPKIHQAWQEAGALQ